MNAPLRRGLIGLALMLVLPAAVRTAPPAAAGAPPETLPTAAGRAAPLDAPLAFAPLDTPLAVTGGFGEYRIGHFHAGFDFGTGGVVGKPVRAPLSGHLERVRTSGAGYGRSLYLRATDGRLIQFGHLDAFMEPVAAWVDSIHRSRGQYEQDLWPEAWRFPVRAGQRIAWTGQSGAGGPHLHFEIRRGDTAFQPQRAGLSIRDTSAPTLVDVTFDPLDDSSFVAGRAAPVTVRLDARPDTVHLLGRVRALVGARDGVWRGVDRMVPWLTRLEWGDEWLECRMDSISWATDMSEGDYVFDAGRVIGEKGIVLQAPAGWRPKFFRTNVPRSRDAGTIVVRPGDPPRRLRLVAQDVSGNRTVREVVVVAHDPADLAGVARRDDPMEARRRRGRRAVRIGGSTGTMERPDSAPGALGGSLRAGAWGWTIPADALFEAESLFAATTPAPEAAPGLIPVGNLGEIGPATTPLRRAVTLHVPGLESRHGDRLGLYREGSDGWELIGWTARADGAGWDAETRRLGRFALFADTLAPRIAPRPAPRTIPAGGPYSTWAIEAELTDSGSGVLARGCHYLVDGRREAAEWDSEASVLRWRPRRPPAAGRHRATIEAADRAGNVRRATFEFVVP